MCSTTSFAFFEYVGTKAFSLQKVPPSLNPTLSLDGPSSIPSPLLLLPPKEKEEEEYEADSADLCSYFYRDGSGRRGGKEETRSSHIRKQEGGKHTTLQRRVKKGRRKLGILFWSLLPPFRRTDPEAIHE